MPAGPDRDKRLADLSQGDPIRMELFKSLADMSDQLAAAKAIANGPNPTPQQINQATKVLDEVGQEFDDAKAHIEDENINADDLQATLDGLKSDPDKFGPKLTDLKNQYANFPLRLAAINDFQQKYAAYDLVKASIDDAADLKRLLKGSGVLEFHMLAYDQTDPKYRMMYDRMKPGGKGPTPQPGDDTYRWMMVDRPEEFDKPGQRAETVEWNDKHYLLAMITPEASMTKGQNWSALERAFPSSNDFGEWCVGFQFDANGGHLFSDLTTRSAPKGGMKYEMAIVLMTRSSTAPVINGPITGGSGIIEGGEGGYSDEDFQYLINTLNAGSFPRN